MENGNKLIVVTGGTKGIGRAIIERYAKEGFPVATCSRNEDDLASLKEAIREQYGIRIFTQVADLSIRKQVTSFIDFIQMTGIPVEVLVNNSGRFIPGEIINEKEGILEELIQTNLYSAYHVSRGLIKGLIKKKSGHIFNMCSVASLKAYPNGGSYSISKFALYGLSKALREELKDSGIRVTSVLPGATYTASWEGSDLPEERFMKSEDVAEMVYSCYILSERSVVEDLVIRPREGDL